MGQQININRCMIGLGSCRGEQVQQLPKLPGINQQVFSFKSTSWSFILIIPLLEQCNQIKVIEKVIYTIYEIFILKYLISFYRLT